MKIILLLLALAITGCASAPRTLGLKDGESRVEFGRTDSMEPTIWPGQYYVLTRTPYAPKIGDVVVYWSIWHAEFICHRVFAPGAQPGTFITKGDNVAEPDRGLLTAENYCGTVTRIVPRPFIQK